MALPTTLQYTESNLIGSTLTALTATGSSFTAEMVDAVSGEPREPDPDTKLFVLAKGTAEQPSRKYEIIYVPGGTTTTDGITTFSSVVRNLSFSGISLSSNLPAPTHIAGTTIGTVDVHFLWNTLTATLQGVGDQPLFKIYATETARNTDVTVPSEGMYCYVQSTDVFYFYDGTRWVPAFPPTFQNAAARDAAITNPRPGMSAVLVDEGVITDYYAGSWNTRGSSTTPNASTSVSGKVQESVAAENVAGTGTGGTGARLFINPTALSTTGATSRIPISTASVAKLDRSWLYDIPYLTLTAGENISAGEAVYIEQSDGKAYRAGYSSAEAAAVVGVCITTVTTDDTGYFQTSGVVTGLSGLTAGGSAYLGAAGGSITATTPAMNSSSVYPVYMGRALSTTSIELSIQRLPRIKYMLQTVAAGTANYTLSVGFPIGAVSVSFTEYLQNSTSIYCYSGFFNAPAGTYGGNTVSNNFIELIGQSNPTTTLNYWYYVPTVNSTDLLLTRNSTGAPSGALTTIGSACFQVYELL